MPARAASNVLISTSVASYGVQRIVTVVLLFSSENLIVVRIFYGQFGAKGWRDKPPCASENVSIYTKRSGDLTSRI